MNARRVHAAQVHAANRRRESREAAARAARDLVAFEALARQGRLGEERLCADARARLEAAVAEAAPYWSRRARRAWLMHPEQLAGVIR